MNLILKGHEKDLGDHFIIKRVLPSMEKRSIGPFVFFDHFGPTQLTTGTEMVVRSHPHIGLATITFLYDGLIHHRDSLGISQLIRPFETNWMVAGSGIAHSERSEKDPHIDRLEGIQTWIALPKEKEEIDPSFQHLPSEEIPIWNTGGLTFRLLGGEFLHLISNAITHSPLFYADIESSGESDDIAWSLPQDQEAGLYVSRGEIEVFGKKIGIGEMAVFELGSEVKFKTSKASRLMLLGGKPFPEKRFLWWNFVSTDQEKIEKAKLAWSSGSFPKVPNEVDRIPLPPH
jgi:redox-sensitive bicupin YhaK (pirin superfamily)